jgi:UrcA family protein
MSSRNTTSLATLVAAIAVLGSSAASAATAWQMPQRTISLRSLDPAVPGDAYKLYRDIVSAADQVCGTARVGNVSIAAVKQRQDAELCAQRAIAAAVQTVNAALGLDLEQLAGIKRSYIPEVAQAAGR